MITRLFAISLIGFSLNAYANCSTFTVIPDDQLAAIKTDQDVYFRTAHAYNIFNPTTINQYYHLCNRTILDNGEKKSFINEECVSQKVKPGQSFSKKLNLYTYGHFVAKGKLIDVVSYSTIEGLCETKSTIRRQVKVQ